MKSALQKGFVYVLAITLLIGIPGQINSGSFEKISTTGVQFAGITWQSGHLKIVVSLLLTLIGSGIFSFKQHRDNKKCREEVEKVRTDIKQKTKDLNTKLQNVQAIFNTEKERKAKKKKELNEVFLGALDIIAEITDGLGAFDLLSKTLKRVASAAKVSTVDVKAPIKGKKKKKQSSTTREKFIDQSIDNKLENIKTTKNSSNPFPVNGDTANPLSEINV